MRVAQEYTSDCTRCDFGDVLLNADESSNAEGAQVAEIRSPAEADFEGRESGACALVMRGRGDGAAGGHALF